MCDERTLKDWARYLEDALPVSRRRFGALTAGAGVAAALPPVAGAQFQPILTGMVEIETPDGVADCFMTHIPDGSHAGVIVWPDILGLRPTFMDLGRRLAAQGYAVLVVNPFYRSARAPVVPEGASFGDTEVRERVFSLAGELDPGTHFTDARAFVDYLDRHGSVAPDRRIGTIGYCMGGPMVMRTAAARPDRIGAAATFHGGGLATDADDSPHLLIPEMSAEFLIAVAENDDANDPEAKSTLRESFDAAGLAAEIEVYEGAQHGWCVPDSAVYHDEQAERAWSRLLALFERALA
ncbi:MAG TPA: dienelactone hydrolase family protein [Gammaproteobacteria bacterium]|nr:dienelactone hydrolase family protein [Gammaproteobacteria bacterium]